MSVYLIIPVDSLCVWIIHAQWREDELQMLTYRLKDFACFKRGGHPALNFVQHLCKITALKSIDITRNNSQNCSKQFGSSQKDFTKPSQASGQLDITHEKMFAWFSLHICSPNLCIRVSLILTDTITRWRLLKTWKWISGQNDLKLVLLEFFFV